MRQLLPVALLTLVSAGCRCGPSVENIDPAIGVLPAALDFGQVKNGSTLSRTLKISSLSQASLTVSGLSLQGGSAPGGEEGFSFTDQSPIVISALGSADVAVRFSPTAFEAYEAQLVLTSNDPAKATVRVPLLGEGAKPIIKVVPDCKPALGCTGTVTAEPLAIDFGQEPTVRLSPIDPTALPTVVITNEGPVELAVTKLAIEGADAAAFAIVGNATLPLTLDAAAGVNVPIRFTPTSEAKDNYAATLKIESDDFDHPALSVALTGRLRANLPPVVCANLIKTKPPLDQERDYSSAMEWSKLLTVPQGGYDFTATREVEPDAEYVIFSALSDTADATKCTTDPDDRRTGLTYTWEFVSWPAGATAPAVSVPFVGAARFAPGKVVGQYRMRLTVADAQGHSTVVPIAFAVALKQDLVAQVQWEGFSDVDLDLHLVRPTAVTSSGDPFSGVFQPFQPTMTNTSGDINGWAARTVRNNVGAGFNFNWGGPGTSDDPRLNLDETGSGSLIENISLNAPEQDEQCASARCNYKVLVHYFRDGRTGDQGPCAVDGGVDCGDGERCSCPSENRCVASSLDAGVGTGRCVKAPKPVVKIFLKGSAVPAKTIPLDTLMPADELVLGAPCTMYYVADVEWPARTETGSLPDGGTPPPRVIAIGESDAGTMRIVAPSFARFGQRNAGDIRACSPNTTASGQSWYEKQ